jgi:ketosteroid isomerase-like protein
MGQARELMDRSTQAWVSQDLDAVRACYSPGVVVSTPDAGTLQGIDQFLEWMNQFLTAFPDVRYESEQQLEAGNCAIDQGTAVGTHSGPLALPDGGSIPATGKQIRMRSCDIATVEGGVITRHDFYFDQLDLAVQLGVLKELAATV